MDRKAVIVLTSCSALFALWVIFTPKLFPPPPPGSRTNALASASNAPVRGTNGASATTSPSLHAATNDLAAVVTTPGAPEETLVLTHDAVRYVFTTHGGGIKQIELLKYPESVACGSKLAGPTNRLATLNGPSSKPILSVLNTDEWQGDGVFKLSRYTRPDSLYNARRMAEGVRAEKVVGNKLYLVKEFEPTSNYLMQVRVRIENRSTEALALPAQQWVVGSATPMNPHDDESMVGLHWHNGSSATTRDLSWFDNKTLGCFPGTPRQNFFDSSGQVTWATANNQFFFVALMPKDPAQVIAGSRYDWPAPSKEELAADPTARTNQTAILVSLHHSPTNLAAGAVLERDFTLFAGPKEYSLLQHIGAVLKNDLDKAMGFSGFFGFFSGILLLSMNALHSIGLSYALAIIVITVIVKLLFWPLTQASTRSMKRMQALQPQIKALQERYKDDPKKQQQKMMEFWREHKVNPVGGCLPMLLQIPVFIGFFQMVRTAIELRGATFLWACDLSKPDTIFVIPGLNFPFNPLPLLMGVTMLWQARLQPAAPGMDPAQQKMMKYLPLMFLLMLYNYSAGLTLYWTVQNLLTILQTKLTKSKEPAAPVAPGKPLSLAPKKK